MSDLIVKIEKETRKVTLGSKVSIGNDHENLQENLVFQFDEFVDGQARLEYEINEIKNYIILQKENETYTIPVQNVITIYQEQTKGKINFQLVITEGTETENIPVFKSNIFFLICRPSINAVTEAPEGYDLWIEQANAKLNAMDEALAEVDNLNIDANKVNNTTTITITKKDGTIQEVVINDGQDGQDGKDAKINGKKSIEIEAGTNITIDDTQNGIRINSTGGGSGGTSNYNDLSNKPKINNVELSGNKSLNDLGIQPKGNYLTSETDPTVPSYVKNITQANITSWNNKADISDIPDVSNFITRNVNNLVNYTLKTNTGSLIDLEINDTTYVVTLKLKNQDGTVISTDTIDLPLESVVVSGRYDNTTKKVILTLENGSEVDFSVADLVAGLQTEITSSNKLASDLIDDSNSGNKFVTTSEKQTWNNKYDKPSTGIPKADLASDVQTSLGKADTALQSHQDISGKANKISVVQTSASTIEINSNTFYKFGEVASLTITLASITDNTIYNEYMFEFVSGTTATTLTLPSSIKWLETPTIDANKIYQCSIVDNIGLLVGVTNV